jgi:hypothetical protein
LWLHLGLNISLHLIPAPNARLDISLHLIPAPNARLDISLHLIPAPNARLDGRPHNAQGWRCTGCEPKRFKETLS